MHPDKCDRCGLCMRACPGGRLKVGGGYIYVDASECDGCFSCVEVCERGAIVRALNRPVAFGGKGAGQVVVGSRAEAKQLRAEAAREAKTHGRAEPRSGSPLLGGARAAVAPLADRAATSTARSSAAGVEWGLIDAAAVATVLMMLIALKDAVFDAPAMQVMPATGKIIAGSLVLAVFYAIQFGLFAFLARRHGATLPSAFRLRTGFDASAAAISAAIVAGLALGTRMMSLLWGAFALGVGWNPPVTEGSSLTAVFGPGPLGLALAFVLAVVVGPISEELAFRGVIAPALDRRFGRLAAILGSAGLFAFYHVTPWLFVPMFVFGCALAWLALSRRSLWPAIALHAVYNGLVVMAVFWLAR